MKNEKCRMIFEELVPGGMQIIDDACRRANASSSFQGLLEKHDNLLTMMQATMAAALGVDAESFDPIKLEGVQHLIYNVLAIGYFAAKDEK